MRVGAPPIAKREVPVPPVLGAVKMLADVAQKMVEAPTAMPTGTSVSALTRVVCDAPEVVMLMIPVEPLEK